MKIINRRSFLKKVLLTSGVALAGQGLLNFPVFSQSAGSRRISNLPNLGSSLKEISVINDPYTRMRVPEGFSVREVARTGKTVIKSSEYQWHGAPDGGAVFAIEDGGWIYVSNAELGKGRGGVGAIRFDRNADIIDSYSILSGTSVNCAGGPTPWGTWLSCEEHETGLIYECDPVGKDEAVACPMLGSFKHEAAAVDPVYKYIYLTEDEPDGNLYRFTPEYYPDNGRADLSTGILEVAVINENNLDKSRPVKW